MLIWKFRSFGGEARVLAIFIRMLEHQSQFYTMTGGWVHRRSNAAFFSVPHFVDPQELDNLLPYLPTTDVPPDMEDRLHSLSLVVPRSIGLPLIRKMVDFSNQSDAAYMANAVKLDNPYVAYPDRFRYAALDEIASLLLPETLPRTEDGKFAAPVLYAVHRALLSDGMGFRPPHQRTLRAGGHYEIMSAKEMTNIEFVKNLVRVYVDDKFASRSGTKAPTPNLLERFVIKAQRRIDRSRKTRPFTKSEDATNEERLSNFDSTDMRIIKFLESWTALRSFMLFSPLNGIAAAILRAVERYDEEIVLNKATAWTFLQEVGIIAPWENRAAYDLRVPGISLQLSGEPAGTTDGFIADKLKNLRQDWGSLPVYCVDDTNAKEIDDGFSIEAADTPDQYWVHVHIADPGAHTDPTSKVAEYAQSLVATIYMPERVVPMLAPSFVEENLSLAPNRPCLTFSAKLNTGGDLLDYKVTPGTIHNVQFITPRVVEEVLLGSASKKIGFHLVGPDIPPPKPRRMVESHELSNHDKENLRLLQVIGKANKAQRVARGGILNYRKRAERPVSVSLNSPLCARNGGTVSYHDDPSIKMSAETDISTQGALEEEVFDIVQPVMIIAGEVAARWCNDRGIPVVYRVTPRNEDTADPAEFFIQNILPTVQEGKFDEPLTKTYMRLLGYVQLSTTPGPHVAMGSSMVARCTSPLRRYPDLLLHWQVEAAILEEARLGQSLVGNTRDDFLPFTKAQLDALLPHIDGRERLIQYGQRASDKHWVLQLMIRAWLFGQEAIPRSFSFVVVNTMHDKADSFGVAGVLGHFGQAGLCTCPDWTIFGEVQLGDIFEVELTEVNTYLSHVQLRPLRRLNASEKEKLDQENLSRMRFQDTV
jgi:hypothetical protein